MQYEACPKFVFHNDFFSGFTEFFLYVYKQPRVLVTFEVAYFFS